MNTGDHQRERSKKHDHDGKCGNKSRWSRWMEGSFCLFSSSFDFLLFLIFSPKNCDRWKIIGGATYGWELAGKAEKRSRSAAQAQGIADG